jgi:hypothetical protein
VAEGLRANEDDKALLIRNRIKAHEGRQDLYDIGYRTDTTGIHYRRILLPVWILHYSHRGRPYRVVVSGIDGRTFGERPFSALKARALFRGDHGGRDRGGAGVGRGGFPVTGRRLSMTGRDDCRVFCSCATVPCPPVQAGDGCCG